MSKLWLMVSAVLLGPPAWPQCVDGPLGRSMSGIERSQPSLIAALLELGKSEGICFGIEAANLALLTAPVAIMRSDLTVGELLHASMAEGGGYSISSDDNVILIRPRVGSQAPSQLDLLIPSYNIEERVTVQRAAALRLFVRVKSLLAPSQSVAGSFSDPLPNDYIVPFNADGESVRRILTRIVASSHGGSWLAGPCPVGDGASALKPCWSVLEYPLPADLFRTRVAAVIAGLKEDARERERRAKNPADPATSPR